MKNKNETLQMQQAALCKERKSTCDLFCLLVITVIYFGFVLSFCLGLLRFSVLSIGGVRSAWVAHFIIESDYRLFTREKDL